MLKFIPGQIFLARFKLIRLLGEGGMGQVWQVHDQELEEDAVVKILKSNLATDPYQIDLLRNECRNSRRLVHPNILRTYDFHRSGNLAFISMEYVPGENLNANRKRLGRLDPGDMIARLLPVAEALAFAHDKGVVHRDVKPANILIDRDQNSRLSDFGIAGAVRAVGPELRITSGGSLHYMSPDQLQQRDPRPSDDIYALGAVMYDMLCGHPPFYPDISEDKIRREMPPSVNAQLAHLNISERVPVALDGLIQRMLAKTAQERPQSMDQVAAALSAPEMINDPPTEEFQMGMLQPPTVPPGESRPIEPVDVRPGDAAAAEKGRPTRNWAKGALLAVALAIVFVGGALVLRYLAENPVYMGDNGKSVPEPKPPVVHKIPDDQKKSIETPEPQPATSPLVAEEVAPTPPEVDTKPPTEPEKVPEPITRTPEVPPSVVSEPRPEPVDQGSTEPEPADQDFSEPESKDQDFTEPEPAVKPPETGRAAIEPEEPEPAPIVPDEIEQPEPPRVNPAITKAEAEAAMAAFVSVKTRLDRQQADKWGGDEYARLADLGERADTHMVNRQYPEAARLYAQAEKLAQDLEAQSGSVLEKALDEGQQALDAGNTPSARHQFGLALLIDPENPAAKSGLERVNSIEAVNRLLASGDTHEKAGRLTLALADYEAALKKDARSDAARNGVARITSQIARQRFHTLMSAGMAALHDKAYAKARAQFLQARALKPGSPEVGDALAQVDAVEKLERIQVHKQIAEAAESIENWDQALAAYKAALGEDGALQFALQGTARASRHLNLMRRMQVFLDDPALLEKDAYLERALVVLEDAEKGPLHGENIQQKLKTLDQQVHAAQTPVKMVLQSDNETEVAVYKVGKMGRFEVRELDLRPGRYTVVGSRPGFKDVRLSIHLPAGTDRLQFTIQCTEKI
jgi:serine/threonine protein kinase/tetratricopeptide (TPR) repeat protein